MMILPRACSSGDFGDIKPDGSYIEFNCLAVTAEGALGYQVVVTNPAATSGIFRNVYNQHPVLTAEVNNQGVVTITPKKKGTAKVTVTADMPEGTDDIEGTFTVTVLNRKPRVANGIEDLQATVGSPFEFTFDSNTFTDPDPEDRLTYAASEPPEAPWLQFDPATRTFSGTPTANPAGTILVTVTASDGVDIATDTFTININQPPTIVGTLANVQTTAGATVSVEIASKFSDPGDTLRYTAESSNENAATVAVEGDNLSVTAVAAGSTRITVTATDTSGLFTGLGFTVNVDAANAPPTGIALTSTRIDENAAANSVVGTLSATDDGIGTLSYTLLEETDYRAFTITGNQLTINAPPDYETQSSYAIRIRVSDGEFTYSEAFTITVNNVADTNTAPTDIALSKTDIDENAAPNSVVGTLSATDDGVGTLVYTFIQSGDYRAFTITGDTLTINASPDYETRSSYSIRIQVSDGQYQYAKTFTISVNDDGNTAPTGITLSRTDIDENVAANSVVGTLSATDDGRGTLAYTLVAGNSDIVNGVDNGAFTITGSTLTINASPDYETQSSYRIRIQVFDGEFAYSAAFAIRVNDVNEAPTGIALTATRIDENVAVNSVVGTLSASDDGIGTLVYTLVSGNGDIDNRAFTIIGTTLTINASPDYETQPRYRIRIQVSDGQYQYADTFTILVNDDGNTAPTDIALSRTDIDENAAANSVVGTLSAIDDGIGTLAYTLAAGNGDTDNGAFTITGNQLTINASPDYETQSSYSIRIQVSDEQYQYMETFTITVNDVNEAPTGIALSRTDIDENVAANSVVGTLSATDDGLGTLAYTLAAGNGDIDNRAFTIIGSTLSVNASPDYETKSSYSIRIQVSDGQYQYAEAFTISVNDVNDAPTGIALSRTDIDENVAANSVVGTLSATDDGRGTLAYTLVAGNGDINGVDNGAFTITGSTLSVNASPDYEAQSSYRIRIQVSDGEFAYSAPFTITVNDVNDAPTGIALTSTRIDENIAANSVVGTLSATDDGIGTLVYTLVSGNGDIDNGDFTITGTTLTINASPDYETQSSYAIRIQVSDGQYQYADTFTILVNDDGNIAPTDIALSKTDIDENAAANSVVGTLSAIDDGIGTLAYTLVAGNGGPTMARSPSPATSSPSTPRRIMKPNQVTASAYRSRTSNINMRKPSPLPSMMMGIPRPPALRFPERTLTKMRRPTPWSARSAQPMMVSAPWFTHWRRAAAILTMAPSPSPAARSPSTPRRIMKPNQVTASAYRSSMGNTLIRQPSPFASMM